MPALTLLSGWIDKRGVRAFSDSPPTRSCGAENPVETETETKRMG
jgi:hypothetical protein